MLEYILAYNTLCKILIIIHYAIADYYEKANWFYNCYISNFLKN
jgi:hypothetical protein